jgi:hypothetical protein
MTLEELDAMWKEDCVLDETDLISETQKIPKLHNKYFTLYVQEGLRVKKLKSKLAELEKNKTEYYNGTMDIEDIKKHGWKPNPVKILRQDIIKYIESDKEVIDLSLKIDYYISLEKYLEDIIKQINNRNFLIKNIIEWSKFTSGG